MGNISFTLTNKPESQIKSDFREFEGKVIVYFLECGYVCISLEAGRLFL